MTLKKKMHEEKLNVEKLLKQILPFLPVRVVKSLNIMGVKKGKKCEKDVK